ncbi:MAG: hypothetical protein ACYS0D_14905 [Planctomycetota bacterium]
MRIGDDVFVDGPGSLPLSGGATVEIDRHGEDVTVRWDDELLLSGNFTLTAPLSNRASVTSIATTK